MTWMMGYLRYFKLIENDGKKSIKITKLPSSVAHLVFDDNHIKGRILLRSYT
ncbi:hypothetical protein NIES4101_49220 [Calothrix sp. NIES-4101]|nr:hypothetical protein NIES4101_49220 [Calothrix sp. NIES-4101]